MDRTIITIREYCLHHGQVEPGFIEDLVSQGLLKQVTAATEPSIYIEELRAVEQYSRMHYELDINIAGIETIVHLLERMRRLQEEVQTLRRLLPGAG